MKEKTAVTYEMIANALFENYESIYDIDLETSEYKTYYQSNSYQELELSRQGEDFFEALPKGINRRIALEDRDYVLGMLQKDALVAGVQKEKYYTLVYQIQSEGRKIFHQLRATQQPVEGGMHILMGIRNIDDLVRQQIAQRNAIEAMQQKERNHLEAVLASAAAYMEANLSQDRVLEKSVGRQEDSQSQILDVPSVSELSGYTEMQNWITGNRIVINKEKYREISSREYLLACFQRGDKRASVSFSITTRNGDVQPCRAVFYLYQERSTGDVHVFCVIYDLTQEQELEALERELLLSRIRNSTSQMQPHFLYNALGSIQEVILMDPQYASDLLEDFTVHLRSCVKAMTNDEPIPFTEELRNIKAYVNIEKMRMGKKLEVQYDIETMEFQILPLCIQPLVENAIRHGIYRRGKAGGKVILRTKEDETSWIIQVQDDGVGFDAGRLIQEIKSGKKDSTGLENIRFRLEKVMGASVELQSTEGTGTTVTIRLPKEETEDEGNYCR